MLAILAITLGIEAVLFFSRNNKPARVRRGRWN